MARFISPLKEQFKKTIAKFQGHYDVIIIGAGSSGLSLATSLYDCGEKSLLLIEKEDTLGGVLNYCTSDGFGKDIFQCNLRGDEFVHRLVKGLHERHIPYRLRTTALSITEDKCVYTVSPTNGLMFYRAKAIVYAVGAHEVPRGSLCIPGTRPDGVYSAGSFQHLLRERKNIKLEDVVIFGSNDVGLSAAHTLFHAGVNVKMVIEPHEFYRGGNQNKLKSIDEHNIPLKLSHTIVQILGSPKLEKIVVAETDKNGVAIKGTEQEVECKTLLISMGLAPETAILEDAGVQLSEKTKGPVVNDKCETSLPGLFAVGNALFIHDTAERIVKESIEVAVNVINYINNNYNTENNSCYIDVECGNGLRFIAPERINLANASELIRLSCRAEGEHENCTIVVKFGSCVYQTIKKSTLHSNCITTLYIYKDDLKKSEANTVRVYIEDV